MEWIRNRPDNIGAGSVGRRCYFEQMESRQLLAADLAVGADSSFGFTGGPTGSISGNVLAAQLSSCESHETAAALAGVRVQLLDETGAVVEESFTDEQGSYQFANLIPGQYAVRQLTPAGFSTGVPHVGGGGGIALNTNHMSEISVQAGETLAGYDFCDFEIANVLEIASVAVLPSRSLSFQPSLFAPQELLDETAIDAPTATPLFAQPPLIPSRPAEVFVGSGRGLQAPESIKAWDEYPAEGLFSTADDFELAISQPITIDELVSVMNEPDESDDAPFADRYTVIAFDGWESETRIDLEQLWGDTQLIDSEGEFAETAQPHIPKHVPKIALREDNTTQSK